MNILFIGSSNWYQAMIGSKAVSVFYQDIPRTSYTDTTFFVTSNFEKYGWQGPSFHPTCAFIDVLLLVYLHLENTTTNTACMSSAV